MRILLVTHYFPPEIGAPQARLSELARHWTESGDEVTVLTGVPNHPLGTVPPEYRGKLRLEEQTDGYRIVRCWLYATPNEGVAKKTLGHLSFMVSSVLIGGRASGPADVVLVSSPTFFSIFAAWLLARIKRAHFVLEVRDLWPAIFVELGVLKNRWLIKGLEVAELAAYGAADAVVVVTEGFRDALIRRGIPGGKVHTIANGVDLELFEPAPACPAVRRRLGAADHETLVLYLGAHGLSHGLTTIADAAGRVADAPIRFAFVGEGAAKRQLAEHVRGLGLTNVTMLPGVAREEVPELLAAADICLVPLRDVPLFSTFIPSKMFEYLGAGKAVIGAVRGEPAEILRAAGALVVEPGDESAIAAAVRQLAGNRSRRDEMGRQGRRYVERHFDRRVLSGRYRQILAAAAGEARPLVTVPRRNQASVTTAAP